MGSNFEGSEGQMARDISKMTFKKLIQFRKSFFCFRNAPRNLHVDLPRTRYLRGMRFANPENFQVSLSKFWTCMENWEANLLLACTPAILGSTLPDTDRIKNYRFRDWVNPVNQMTPPAVVPSPQNNPKRPYTHTCTPVFSTDVR